MPQPWLVKKGFHRSPDAPSLLHVELVIPKLWDATNESFGKTQP